MAAVLSGHRLLVKAALVLVLPGILAAAAMSYQRPPAAPAEIVVASDALPQAPSWLLEAEQNRSRQVTRLSINSTTPTLLDAASTSSNGLPTLAVTSRDKPYTLAELRRLVPAAFADLTAGAGPGGAVLLTANLQVPLGSTLLIDEQTPDVRLLSTAAGFATIFSRGSVKIVGGAMKPVRISSWDPVLNQVDRDSFDGRSFIAQIGGRMDVEHAVFDHLGFDLGFSSGVSWIGIPSTAFRPDPIKAQGSVTSSTFSHNYFGAYTREADGMQWLGNIFSDNEKYGFDPHDFTNNLLVAGNVAYGNGRHGFIFSRGCDHNVLRDNISRDNAGHGFMIDDGRSVSTIDAQARINGSNDNLLVNNSAYANAGNGIEIEGGTGNVITGNRLGGNSTGVWIKSGAAVEVRDNMIVDNLRYGIDVGEGTKQTMITGNTIHGSWGAFNLDAADSAVLTDNVVGNVSASLAMHGFVTRETSWVDRFVAYLHKNPMLVLWSLVLGVPFLLTATRFHLPANRARRRWTPSA